MADNKEITTLHPYMNRNKNRYPNVKEENIPDTIQRKLTAGQGINISPENVISATGSDSYTRDETDALLDTKADKVALENVNKAVPTDIAVKDGKLGLEHDTTWLTNQNAITLGDGLVYDESTKTLKASGGGGGKLPAGTEDDPFQFDRVSVYGKYQTLYVKDGTGIGLVNKTYNYPIFSIFNIGAGSRSVALTIMPRTVNASVTYQMTYQPEYTVDTVYVPSFPETSQCAILYAKGKYSNFVEVPTDKTESYYLTGTYDATSNTSTIKWSALKKTYNHYIVINDTTTANAIYLLIPSTNNLKCNSLTDLNTLLGTAQRFIQASGVVTGASSKLPIVALNWQGSIATSKILTMSSEEATTKFTNVVDVVEPA